MLSSTDYNRFQISFYTYKSIDFLLDVNDNKAKYEKSQPYTFDKIRYCILSLISRLLTDLLQLWIVFVHALQKSVWK